MKKRAKPQRESVFLVNGVPHNMTLDADALEEKGPLPPDALEKLVAGRLSAGTVRRLRGELQQEAIARDEPEALRCLLPKRGKLPPEDFEALLRAAEEADSPRVRALLLQFRRERYTAGEWEASSQRRLDLELGLAEPTLAELKRLYKISFAPEGLCFSGVKKPELAYAIPAAVEGRPVVSVSAEAFYALAPAPRVSRAFAGEGSAIAPTGDTVFFGRRAERRNAAERPIPWRVLRREEGRALLLCAEAVARLPYHAELEETTWERCALRRWLNEIFLPLSFTPAERTRIVPAAVTNPDNRMFGTPGGADTVDRLFLPSAEELRRWLPDERDRALGQWYWTRTPGHDNTFALAVTPEGAVSKVGTFVDAADYAVRPALWAVLPQEPMPRR